MRHQRPGHRALNADPREAAGFLITVSQRASMVGDHEATWMASGGITGQALSLEALFHGRVTRAIEYYQPEYAWALTR